MTRLNAALAFAALAAVLPARGDDDYYEAPPAEVQAQVDVSVDMGAPGASVTFDTFQQSLAPYGQWVSTSAYGPVWRPTAAPGWRPYYYGHWAWTDEGWLWVSEEPWGWGPYHYGRWFFDASWGWLWVPGYQWAPAWVSWRYSGDVVGWAPLAPGVSIYFAGHPSFYAAWTFVPCQSFVGVPVRTIAYAPGYSPSFFQRTMPAPPRAAAFGRTGPAWGGPAHGFLEQRFGRAIPATPIAPVASPAQVRPGQAGGPVTVFRPPAPTPAPGAGTHPGWGSPRNPGWGPPGRVPAPGAMPGSRPSDNRPGWGTPPSRGPAPVAPGPRSAPGVAPQPWRGGPAAPPGAPAQRGWAPSPGGAPPASAPRSAPGPSPWRGGAAAPQGAPAQRGWAPPSGGGPPASAPRFAPAQAPRGGAPAPAPRGSGGQAPGRGGERR